MDYSPQYDLSKAKNFKPNPQRKTENQIVQLVENGYLDKIAFWMNEHYNKNPIFTAFVDEQLSGRVNGRLEVNPKTFSFEDYGSIMIQAALEHDKKEIIEFLIHDPINKKRKSLIYPDCEGEEIVPSSLEPSTFQYLLQNKVWYNLPLMSENFVSFNEDMVKNVCSYFFSKNDLKSLKLLSLALEDINSEFPTSVPLKETVDKFVKNYKFNKRIEKVLVDPAQVIESKLVKEKKKLAQLESDFSTVKSNIEKLEQQYLELNKNSSKKLKI